MATNQENYPAKLDIEYPKQLDRLSSFFRIFWSIPILVVITLLTSTDANLYTSKTVNGAAESSGGIISGLIAATALMILFRQRYPKWWFDFNLELNRFSTRVGAYLFLLTDRYPSTVDKQSVNLDVTYPNVQKDLNRWLPLVKWLMAIPHYFVLMFLIFAALVCTVVAWFAILFTGRYPRGLFDYMVGVGRWCLRVNAYAFLLTTDKYPPFSLK